ncbi:MAG: helix-turn-helix domain-containing protein [Pseudomonadota bacterium]|jgi:Fis family transcriptional regulator
MKPVEVAAADGPDSSWSRNAREQEQPLAQCVASTVRRYLDDLGDSAENNNLYQLLLEQIEKPLLAVVMEKARGNRCRAAELLGINRNTLRKKLQQYGL